MEKYNFDLMSAPLRSHGQTLDWLFSETKDQKLLLIDSDLEILSSEVIDFINKHIDQQEVFGSGFLISPTIISEAHFKGKSLEGALYFERPFMPIVLFNTDKVRQALGAGISFCEEVINNEFSLLPKKFYWRAKKFLKKGFRKRYFNSYPPKVVYDTGAKVYEYLRYDHLLFFVHLPESCHNQYVTHYHGATRRVLNPKGNLVGEDVRAGRLETVVAERLSKVYGIRNDFLIEK